MRSEDDVASPSSMCFCYQGGRGLTAGDHAAVSGRKCRKTDGKEAAISEFVKRVAPSRLRVQCLETVLRKRPASLSAARLDKDCGRRECYAKRILATRRPAGLIRQGADGQDP